MTFMQITRKHTEQPAPQCRVAEERLSGEVSVGKSAEAEARLDVTMIICYQILFQKTEGEKKNFCYHFLLVNLLTGKYPL